MDLQRNSLNQPFTRDRYPTAVRDHFLAVLANPPAPTPARKKAATRHATRPAVAEWTIEPCTKVHERSEFSYDKPPLDDCIRSRMSQHEKERLGKTFVAPVLYQKQKLWRFCQDLSWQLPDFRLLFAASFTVVGRR